jgi:hypothetical protein
LTEQRKNDNIKVTEEKRGSTMEMHDWTTDKTEHDVITLQAANGDAIDFVEIAGIEHKGEYFAILQPVKLLDGMEEDEALVFRVYRHENGDDNFEIVLDDEIIDAVFLEYNRILDEVGAE